MQESDLLLHEAGVPPIHTPAAPLLALPAAVRKSLRIIHVSDQRAATDFQGIEMVRAGFEHTIAIPVPPSPYAHSTNILQMLLSTDLFRSLEAGAAIDFLQVVRVRTYHEGDVICTVGDPPDDLRIVQSGTVRYERDGASRELRYCDYFGEVSMLTQTSHLATATATSRVEMVEVSRDSFTHLLSTRPLLRERVMRRSRLRYTASWRAIGANSVFATFSMAQARHARCPQPPSPTPTATPHPDQLCLLHLEHGARPSRAAATHRAAHAPCAPTHTAAERVHARR